MAFQLKPKTVVTSSAASPPSGEVKKLAVGVPVKIGPVRAAPKVFGGEDMIPEPLKIFMFGKQGSGKTYAIKALLVAGYKVYYISTDMGGLGLRSFTAELRSEDPPAMKRLRGLTSIETVADVMKFLYKPAELDPGIWEFDPDFIIWDGYSNFQQVMVPDNIYGESDAKIEDRVTEQKEWMQLKNASLTSLTRFVRIANPVTGKIIHKIVISHEDIRNPSGTIGSLPSSEGVELFVPWFQGSGKQQILGAFDVSIRTGFDRKKKELDSSLGFRYYLGGPYNKMPKRRGKALRALPDEIPGDIMKIILPVFQEEGITKDMVDPLNVSIMAEAAKALEEAQVQDDNTSDSGEQTKSESDSQS